jgi:D-inositol-3-phosphate glycosyltransferase
VPSLPRRRRDEDAAAATRVPDGWFDVELTGRLGPPLGVVYGWALAERGLGHVEVRVGENDPIRARLFSMPRPDVALAAAEASAPVAGWGAIVDLPDDPGREIEISATAVGAGTRHPLNHGTFELGPSTWTPIADPAWVGTLAARADATARSRGAPAATPLRLLVATHQLDLGGAQLLLQEMLRHFLAAPDVECLVVAREDGPLRAELETWGARVHITGGEPTEGAAYESRMRELALLAGEFSPSAALVNTSLVFWGVDLAMRMGIPSVWSIHESAPISHQLNAPMDDHLRARFLAALAGADRLVFEADATMDLYRDHTEPERIQRIDYGVPLERLAAERAALDRERLRAERGIAEDETLIVSVGTIEPRKAQASLSFAFARLLEEFPRARLALVGDQRNAYSQAVGEAVARIGAANRIELVPVTPDTSPWYAMADAFALVSDMESVPRAILEAMAFELPVLATDSFGIPEVVTDSETGILCEPRCLDSLTAALRRLLALEPSERGALGAAGGELVRATRDSAGYGRAYRELLDELVRRPAPEPAPAR